MDLTSKNVLYVFQCPFKITTFIMASSRNIVSANVSRVSTNDAAPALENLRLERGTRKFSMLFQDSDSEGNERSHDETIQKEAVDQDHFEAFHNKFSDKTEGQRHQCLKALKEDSHMQNMAKAVFDFSMTDSDRFKFLFEMGRNLKRMWQFIYLSFFEQELLMLELRYKQHAEDFNRINAVQLETGCISRLDGPKSIPLVQAILPKRQNLQLSDL